MRKLPFLIRLVLVPAFFFASLSVFSQATFPENGIADPRHGYYAFTNATIVKDVTTTLNNAVMVVKDGKIISVGTDVKIPAGAVEIDCRGKYIYPSFIDIYADYGIASSGPQQSAQGAAFNPATFFAQQAQQTNTNAKGPFGWNPSIKSDVDAYKIFNIDDNKAKPLREAGFGTVLSHVRDGIARGTGTVVTLAKTNENLVMLKEKASANYSFNRGTSGESYPSSMMGSIALLRQTYLDAQWYKQRPAEEGVNISLEAWNNNQGLPQIFDANEGAAFGGTGDKWNCLRADRIGDEFGVQYIIKGGGKEYQRIKEMKATNATFIVSLNFPQGQDVEDPNDARFVSLSDMKHWEMAPANAAYFEKAGINFCLTTSDLRQVSQFWTNMRKAMEYGLSESKAFEALTKTPATTLGIYDKVGSLDQGKLANFLITNGPIFNERTVIIQNWIQGEKYGVKEESWENIAGVYKLTINTPAGAENYTLDVKSNSSLVMWGKDTLSTRFSNDGQQVKLSFAPMTRRQRGQFGGGGFPGGGGGFGGFGGLQSQQQLPVTATRLSGINYGKEWSGTGTDSLGNSLTWTAVFEKATEIKPDSVRKKDAPVIGKVIYPFLPFGWEEGNQPKQETILIKNATVWTNEKDGVLQNSDVLLKNGKIAAIGKNLSDASAKVIDGTGKHVTPGIIDEHSHIAAASINEGGQSVTSEVRITDNLDPDDINIYRQLSGGVTSSHILHGSANVIGGQTQLIKLRWGVNDDELKFKGADGFIKFALGENVKRSNFTQAGQNNRYPDTRMGVEQVLIDAFTRAKDYQKAWADYNAQKDKLTKEKKPLTGLIAPRRDLELDALVEILEKKRFITCHSYVQSEITGLIDVADKVGFKVNTFTHILEGYKVADKMLKHGANASTFSDWWAYKMEVEDAIPYNAAIMTRVGLNVAINSDDAEMARRLNQEAAKTMKYGDMTEDQALKMVTLNPAKMLHVDDRVGSLKVGKDGDVVVWSDNPLSIYAKSLYTIVDGTIYFDRQKDEEMQKWVENERTRLIRKMNNEKRSGAPTIPAVPSYQIIHTCSDHGHSHGLLTIDVDDLNNK